MTHAPLLALTLGDPAGIGPELALLICRQWLQRGPEALGLPAMARLVLLGDTTPLQAAAQTTGSEMPERTLTLAELQGKGTHEIRGLLSATDAPVCVDFGLLPTAPAWGQPTAAAGAASHQYILQAIDWAVAGAVDAVTTLPITKATFHLAGVREPGHTEIFAHRTGTTDYAMMLYSDRLAVTLVTIHQSLRSVPGDLHTAEICRVTRLADALLARVRGRRPRLAVLGLNPHAGESGLFGNEESAIIAPAVEQLLRAGLDVEGPLSPDAAFTPRACQSYDGHIVMYHDQGLIPFKMVSVHDGVNVTLGLPIVRTSPDHGTAYDIAGRGQADPTSTLAALRLAARLAAGPGPQSEP